MAGLVACGPKGHGFDDYGDGYPEVDGGIGGMAVGSGGMAVPVGAGGAIEQGGGPSTGGVGEPVCEYPQPQETYLCAGAAYEQDLVGVGALRLRPEPSRYACEFDSYWYPWYYYGGSYNPYDLYDVSGSTGATGSSDYGATGATGDYGATGATGDYGYYGGTGATGGYATGGSFGYGGESAVGGSGGYGGYGGYNYGGYPSTGGSWYYPEPELRSDWCEGERPYKQMAGITFAVGECRLTELALPIEFEEPSYGAYSVKVYGGSSPCDRGELLLTTAGIGTGLPVILHPKLEGVSWISVQFESESSWEDLALRLVDRPAVGD